MFHGIAEELKPVPQGWRGEIPPAFGSFFGHPLGLFVETHHGRGVRPAVSPHGIGVVESILPKLPGVIAKAEAEFLAYTRGKRDRTAKRQILDPHIRITWEDEIDHPEAGRWTLVVSRGDNPGYAYHIVFDRLAFVEIWSGD